MSASAPLTLLEAVCEVLNAGAPEAKTAAAHRTAAQLADGAPIGDPSIVKVPQAPARPEKPRLASPSDVPRRRFGSEAGRAALLHAIAHIEFNAIDLAFDMAARFSGEIVKLGLNVETFIADWIKVGDDEARHFGLITARLEQFGVRYGDMPAHNGLWEAAADTAENLSARLAVAPLILEARGLDVTPDMIDRLRTAGDDESADILNIIYEDEIGHVACGQRWFYEVCTALNREPVDEFIALRTAYFKGVMKPPFNHEARAKAGLPRAFYDPN